MLGIYSQSLCIVVTHMQTLQLLYDKNYIYWHNIMLFYVGAVFYYCLFQLAMFWFCHLLALFWKTNFPFHSRSFQKSHRMKYLHITSVAIGILVPLAPVVVTMAQFSHGKSSAEAVKGGLGFGITRFPPLLCTGRDGDTIFYSLIVPIDVIVMIGMAFLVSLFWIVHKVRHSCSSTIWMKPVYLIVLYVH